MLGRSMALAAVEVEVTLSVVVAVKSRLDRLVEDMSVVKPKD